MSSTKHSSVYNKKLYAFVFVILAVVSGLLFPIRKTIKSVDIPKEGEISKQTIVAPFTFDILKSDDEIKYEQKKIKNRLLAVLRYDENATESVYAKLQILDSTIKTNDTVKNETDKNIKSDISIESIRYLQKHPKLIEKIRYSIDKILDIGVLNVLLVPSKIELNKYIKKYHIDNPPYIIYNKNFVFFVRDSVQSTVKLSSFPTKDLAIEKEILYLKTKNTSDIKIFSEVLYSFVTPNIIYDAIETEHLKEKEDIKINPFKGTVVKGTQIIKIGSPITKEIIEKISSLKMAQHKLVSQNNSLWIIGPYIANITISIFLVFCFGVGTKVFLPNIFLNKRKIISFILLFLVTLVIIKIFIVFFPKVLFLFHSEYTIPYFMGAIIATITLGTPAGILLNFFIALFSGIFLGYNYTIMLYILFIGSIASWITGKIYQYYHFFIVHSLIFTTSVIYLSLLNFFGSNLSITQLITNAKISFIGCSFSILFSYTHKLFEILSNTTSNLRLSKFLNLNFPLLNKLSKDAPGTFIHSSNVANMSVAGANAIGENHILAKLLAYYHDIGKIIKPEYFVENTRISEYKNLMLNSDYVLKPIIASHIREGIRLCDKYGMPEQIKDTIKEHHGTMPVHIPLSNKNNSEYLYTGSKPITKLNTIIMLADIIETETRLNKEKNIKDIIDEAKNIVLSEKQLDYSNMTMSEIDIVLTAFVPIILKIKDTFEK